MVAMPSAAILVVVASLLLGGMVTQYDRAQAGLELQRELQVAMTAIRNAVRHAAPGDATVVAGRLHIQNGADTQSFSRTVADHLEFDPDRSSSGDEFKIIDGTVTAFTVQTTASGIVVDIALEDGDVSTALQSTIAFRN